MQKFIKCRLLLLPAVAAAQLIKHLVPRNFSLRASRSVSPPPPPPTPTPRIFASRVRGRFLGAESRFYLFCDDLLPG